MHYLEPQQQERAADRGSAGRRNRVFYSGAADCAALGIFVDRLKRGAI